MLGHDTTAGVLERHRPAAEVAGTWRRAPRAGRGGASSGSASVMRRNLLAVAGMAARRYRSRVRRGARPRWQDQPIVGSRAARRRGGTTGGRAIGWEDRRSAAPSRKENQITLPLTWPTRSAGRGRPVVATPAGGRKKAAVVVAPTLKAAARAQTRRVAAALGATGKADEVVKSCRARASPPPRSSWPPSVLGAGPWTEERLRRAAGEPVSAPSPAAAAVVAILHEGPAALDAVVTGPPARRLLLRRLPASRQRSRPAAPRSAASRCTSPTRGRRRRWPPSAAAARSPSRSTWPATS